MFAAEENEIQLLSKTHFKVILEMKKNKKKQNHLSIQVLVGTIFSELWRLSQDIIAKCPESNRQITMKKTCQVASKLLKDQIGPKDQSFRMKKPEII